MELFSNFRDYGGLTNARKSGSSSRCRTDFVHHKDYPMKIILMLLGVVLLVVAGVYFIVPADQLPGFFPGHEAGVARIHAKHGIVAGVAGVVLLAAGWWVGRR
jgi:hypothetical protein